MKLLAFVLSLLFSFNNFAQTPEIKKTKQDSIIKKYLHNGAFKYHYLRQEWQEWLDKGIEQDSTIAIFWQEKGMPYWKTNRYDLALKYFNKALALDRKKYLSRSGYLKCIFQKNYRDALIDLNEAFLAYGNEYQNDHTIKFYIALCHLQLGEYEKANEAMQYNFKDIANKKGESEQHFLDLFYGGVINYELKNYDLAIQYFNKSIKIYSNFSDAKYYKGLCFLMQNKKDEAKLIMLEAKANFEKGYTINEDGSFYEPYPYKVNWHMAKWLIPDYKE